MIYEIHTPDKGNIIVPKEIYYQLINEITDYGMIIANRIEDTSKCHIDIEWNPHESFYIPQKNYKKGIDKQS